jgi:hypothetical protein
MPKPNYAFEKRQRELEKKRKKEDKAQKKAGPAPAPDGPPQRDRESAEPASAADTATPG